MSYLWQWKQFMHIDDTKGTDLQPVKYRVSHDQKFWSTFFLLYINDIQFVSTFRDSIMFAYPKFVLHARRYK